MIRMTASKAREEFADALNRVFYGKERLVLCRRKKGIAALISIDDLEFLQQLEDRLDLEAAKKALREKGTVSWEKLKTELGL